MRGSDPDLDYSYTKIVITVPFQYTYLALSALTLGIWAFFFIVNKSFRVKQVILSFIFMIFGPLSELLYIPDYWRPPTLWSLHISNSYMSPEDLIFCFSMIGIVANLVDLFFHASKSNQIRWINVAKLFGCAFIISGVSILLWKLGMNSIFATSAGMALLPAAILIRERNAPLLYACISVGLTVSAMLFAIYWTGLHFVANSEEILRTIWSLYGTAPGIRIAGVPLSELIWGASFGCCFSTIFKKFPI